VNHFYIIYQITNEVNKKFYIGLHKTTNVNDGYWGSGNLIKSAIKKYGKENFTKKILHIFVNKKNAVEKEKEIVNEEMVKDKQCYNIKLGGCGGFDHVREKNLHKNAKNKKIVHCVATNKTIKVAKCELSKYLENGWNLGFLPETLSKMSDAGKRKTQSFEHRKKNSDTKKNTCILEHIETKKRKFVKKEHIEEYLKAGWKIFIRASLKGYKAIYNPLTNKEIKVLPEALDEYIKDGWFVGFSQTRKARKRK
jgi:hypothetical protein